MDEQLILFSKIYRQLVGIREAVKEIDKESKKLLMTMRWEESGNIANAIITMTQWIKARADGIMHSAVEFVENGPYEGQKPGKTPLEGLAEEGESDE